MYKYLGERGDIRLSYIPRYVDVDIQATKVVADILMSVYKGGDWENGTVATLAIPSGDIHAVHMNPMKYG